ncbi:hypothetical protein BJX64DRAFT_254042 [Aspergillus heterothallicus]
MFIHYKVRCQRSILSEDKGIIRPGYGGDRIVLCQISILVIERTDANDIRNYSVWIGDAISHAHELKLYRQEAQPSSPHTRNWRKILWWAILIKECILCVALPQPPRVWPFGTPLLTMSDFAMEDANIEAQIFQRPEATLAYIYILRARLFN